MEQQPTESPETVEFRVNFTAALQDTVDFLGLDEEPYFLPIRPGDLGMDDTRGYEELTANERMIMVAVAYETLGCDEMQPPARIYTVLSDEGDEVEVQVLHTNRSDTGLFLHKVLYSDGGSMFVLAPLDATMTS